MSLLPNKRRLLTVAGEGRRAVLLRYVRCLKLYYGRPRHGMPAMVLVGKSPDEPVPAVANGNFYGQGDLPF